MKLKWVLVSLLTIILVIVVPALNATEIDDYLLNITNQLLTEIRDGISNTILLSERSLNVQERQLKIQEISTGVFLENACEVTSVKLNDKTGEANGCDIRAYGEACKKAREALKKACEDNCKQYSKESGELQCFGMISDVGIEEFDANKHCTRTGPRGEPRGPVVCTASAKCTCDP